MRRFALPIVFSVLLALPSPTEAQYMGVGQSASTAHSGVWAGLGMGWGSALPSCPICARDRSGGMSGYLNVGTSVTERILIGVEGNGWYKGTEDLDQIVAGVSVVTLLYPNADAGLFLKAGLGLTRFEARPAGDETMATANTFGVNVGVGYELRAVGALSVVPYMNILTGSFGTLKEDGDALTGGMNLSLVQFGLGVSLH